MGDLLKKAFVAFFTQDEKETEKKKRKTHRGFTIPELLALKSWYATAHHWTNHWNECRSHVCASVSKKIKKFLSEGSDYWSREELEMLRSWGEAAHEFRDHRLQCEVKVCHSAKKKINNSLKTLHRR